MFGHPKGLVWLALANTGERFGYYTMLAIFTLFLQAKFGFTAAVTSNIFAGFLALVYFLPVLGGYLADKFGYGKMVTSGIIIMFAGYCCLAIPTGSDTMGIVAMFGSLVLIALGTGLFKGNLQVMVGNLYDDPKYSSKRDLAFSIFYMAINIGAMFAPTAAEKVTQWYMGKDGFTYNGDIPALAHEYFNGTLSAEGLQKFTDLAAAQGCTDTSKLGEFGQTYIDSLSNSYHWGFAVACVSLIVSMAIYLISRNTYKHVEGSVKQAAAVKAADQPQAAVQELSPEETKSRIVALGLVFAVVIFFWMAFHQNGLTLTFFARDYTETSVTGFDTIGFNLWNLVAIAIAVWGIYGVCKLKGAGKILSVLAIIVPIALVVMDYMNTADSTLDILPQKFQQFNPFFVVALTPVSMAVFGALAAKGKEPSAPRKIGIGMFIAAVGFGLMVFGSLGLPIPDDLSTVTDNSYRVTPNLLIGTYLILTFAELFLSPMGISFVSKVAPPKYKGLMMGGWFAATAIGNYLVSIIGILWGGLPLWVLWAILVVLCLLSAIFIFSVMKKLEKVA